ncbi:MAG: oxidoreductase, partial [Clostridia bacterium]|nr:oxidoreductase [Clostridia bacterium]
ELGPDDLPPGEVLVRISYSSVNYKDGLAALPEGRVVRRYPMVPGIDLAGTVLASSDPRFAPGARIVATGYDLGVSHFGGYAEYARLPAGWVVPLPEGLDLRSAMALGTAGFTAALAIHRMEENGLRPDRGPVLVTGASGGVGSLAVDMLAGRGYEVVAATGKPDAREYLLALGAARVLGREEIARAEGRPLEHGVWAGAVDTVGAATLPQVLRTTRPHGAVAAIGNASGAAFSTTVMPFILRGVSLLGIDSAYCDADLRRDVWRRLASDLKPRHLDAIAPSDAAHEVTLDGLGEALSRIVRAEVRGRIVVRVGG